MKNLAFLLLLLAPTFAYAQAPPKPIITITTTGLVSITAAMPGYEVLYTIDGTTPTLGSPIYTGPFQLTQAATVQAAEFSVPQSAVSSATYIPVIPCLTGTPAWTASQNLPSSQTGSFVIKFDATPTTSMNGIVGLSLGAATDYPNLAVSVRFNPTGTIDSRNGGVFAALTSIPYVGGQVYHFTLTVNVATHIYSSSVNGMAIGTNYAFRTEQATVAALDTINVNAFVGTATLCNVVVTPVVLPHRVMLNWTPPTGIVVDGYNLYRGSTAGGPYAKVNSALLTGTVYTDTGVVAGGTYFYVATSSLLGTESVYSNEASGTIPTP